MNKTLLIVTALFSGTCVAGVYKCTDATGNTTYQSQPCKEVKEAFEMNVKTGSAVDLNEQRHKEELAEEEMQRLQQEEQQRLQDIENRKQAAIAESEITKALVKEHPTQYSAFAIPPYDPDRLPETIKPFEARLPTIEKMRRQAAEKALAGGECIRVESDELDLNSRLDQLIVRIECSSGKSFSFNESELTAQ